ncbi:CLUMA_CG002725, isoform A [Clunio marinus]|uniref:CLUMA_CG002725, isoform A n=1 Tax=Clunio marinus TaxID=568069 RepID=A0A1J1HL39_9DIPT|nr:CLUMA_CG002725, isoform A [Clunio marinus]
MAIFMKKHFDRIPFDVNSSLITLTLKGSSFKNKYFLLLTRSFNTWSWNSVEFPELREKMRSINKRSIKIQFRSSVLVQEFSDKVPYMITIRGLW